MIVKFIITKEGGVIFGKKTADAEFHNDIAKENGIPLTEVVGGGRADLDTKRIFGKSSIFGPYDAKKLKILLPDWTIENSS